MWVFRIWPRIQYEKQKICPIACMIWRRNLSKLHSKAISCRLSYVGYKNMARCIVQEVEICSSGCMTGNINFSRLHLASIPITSYLSVTAFILSRILQHLGSHVRYCFVMSYSRQRRQLMICFVIAAL